MFLLVGLGNPGKTYANNRHNIGFMILESLEKFYNTSKFIKKFKSEYLKTNINENIVFLLKPMTYMNDSGMAVKEIKDFYNISINNIIVFHDEIDLNLGDVRIKKGGSHNGHNGLKSIDQFIGKNYNRVRIGVSRPSKLYEKNINENVSNWVLSDFTLEDKTIWLNSLIDNMSENISLLINNDTNNFLKNIKQIEF
jgi:PTH1 family peptidyl-tRNA hydrolase